MIQKLKQLRHVAKNFFPEKLQTDNSSNVKIVDYDNQKRPNRTGLQ